MQIVGRGLELGATCFGKLFMASSLIAFIWLLPTLDTALRLGSTPLTPDYMLHMLLGWHWFAVWILTLCLMLLAQGFMVTRLDRIARGGAIGFRAEWGETRRAFLPLLGTLVLCFLILLAAVMIAAVIGSLAGGVVALFAGKAGFMFVLQLSMVVTLMAIVIYLLFTQFLVVLERKRPVAAINGSFALVYGFWWHAFLVLLMLFLLMFGVAILAALPVMPLLHEGDGLRDGRSMLVQGVLQMVMTAVSGPFTLSVMYLVYNDLKLRRRTAT